MTEKKNNMQFLLEKRKEAEKHNKHSKGSNIAKRNIRPTKNFKPRQAM